MAPFLWDTYKIKNIYIKANLNNILRERIRHKVAAEENHREVESHEKALNAQQKFQLIPDSCPPELKLVTCLPISPLSRSQFQPVIFRLFPRSTSLYYYVSSTSFFSSFPLSSSSFDSFSIFSLMYPHVGIYNLLI